MPTENGFLINEDEALKAFLQGMTVSDTQNSTRPVQVRFGNPDLTGGGPVNYPILVLEMVDIRHASERQHSGIQDVPYTPPGITAPAVGETLVSAMPVPVDLVYQAVAYSRHPYHARDIQRQVLLRFPFNIGAIAGIEVPEDNTVRRAYLARFNERSMVDANQKRTYVNTFDLVVESEMYPFQIHRVQTALTATVITDVFVNQDVVVP